MTSRSAHDPAMRRVPTMAGPIQRAPQRRAAAPPARARTRRTSRRPTSRVLLRRWVVLVGVIVLGAFSLNAALASSPAQKGAPAAGGTAASVRTTTRLVVSTEPWHLQAPVSRAVVVPDGASFLILGGLATGDTSTGAIWKVDPTTGSAISAGSLVTPVHDAAGAMLARSAFVFGGGSYSTVATVQALRPHATVAGTVASMPTGRSDLSTVTLGDRAYILGGYTGTALEPQILSTTTGTSFAPAGQLAQPVRYGAVAALNHQIYVIGGIVGTTESAAAQTRVIQRFDPATGKTTVIGHLPVPLAYAAAVALGGRLYVLGGRSGASLSSHIWQISPSSGKASVVGTMASPRSDAGVVMLNHTAYLVGGETTGPLAPLSSVVSVRLVTTRITTHRRGGQ